MKNENYTKEQNLQKRLIALHNQRKKCKSENNRPRAYRLTAKEREQIFRKTGGRCHICGGNIHNKWNADHILPHSAGGKHSLENYLPAHGTCNNYRWHYLPEEFELILKLGVWARTQIEKGTQIGQEIETKFSKCELNRINRRKK